MSEKVRAEADLKQNRADAERYAVLAEKGAVSRQIAEQALTRVRASEAAVESVAKQIAAAEAGVRVARAALANPEIRRAEGETLQRQVSELRAQIRLAESDVSAARAALARADADITDLEIKAPVDGVVITRSAEPGRVAAAGATILSLVDLRRLYLRGFVPEGNIGFVKVGQPAEVFLDSDQKTPIAAEVLRIDPQAMFTPENTYFKEDRVKQVVGVKILLKGGVGAAKPGMPADGRIRTSEPGKA